MGSLELLEDQHDQNQNVFFECSEEQRNLFVFLQGPV